VVAQENTEIGRQLRQSMGVPPAEAFRTLLTFDPRSLPSRKKAAELEQERVLRPMGGLPGAGHGAGHGGPPKGLAEPRSIRPNARWSRPPWPPPAASPERAQNADLLRKEIEAGKALEEMQYRLEGMRQRLYQLDEMVNKVQAFKSKAQELGAALQGSHSLESLGLDLEALKAAARYDDALKKLKEQLAKLEQEEQLAVEKAGGSGVEPIVKGPALPRQRRRRRAHPGRRHRADGLRPGAVALLSVPAFGYAALCLLRRIGRMQQVDALGRRAERHEGPRAEALRRLRR
jgi:hypothetical protein